MKEFCEKTNHSRDIFLILFFCPCALRLRTNSYFSVTDMITNVHRISVMTFNMWQVIDSPANWPQRRLPIHECLTTFTPDILCVQEHHPLFHEVIVEALPNHHTIQDDFVGWQHEGNIYWNSTLFDKLDYGSIDIGINDPWRRLFWVLLKIRAAGDADRKSVV